MLPCLGSQFGYEVAVQFSEVTTTHTNFTISIPQTNEIFRKHVPITCIDWSIDWFVIFHKHVPITCIDWSIDWSVIFHNMLPLLVLIDRLIDQWFFITCSHYLYWLIDWLIREYFWPVNLLVAIAVFFSLVPYYAYSASRVEPRCLNMSTLRSRTRFSRKSLPGRKSFSHSALEKKVIFSSDFYKKNKICKNFHANILTARWLPRFLGTLPDPSRLACSSWGTCHSVAWLFKPNKPIIYTWPN